MGKKRNKIVLLIVSMILIIIMAGILIYFSIENNKVPIMNLVGEQTINMQLNETYEEQGVKAILNEEDVSTKVIIDGNVDITKTGEYKLTYTIFSKNNKKSSSVDRIVIVQDKIAPTITLKGNVEETVYVGDTYKDAGCTAEDNYDGDITDKVVITGEIDTNKEGTYIINYAVEDSSLNKAETTRKVIVKKKVVIVSNSSTNKVNTSSRGLPVLMYHFFYDEKAGESGNDGNWMEVSDFEEQMKYLSENNYYFPSWKEVEDYVNGNKSLPSKSVVITIDDGDASFIKYAIPIIEKYNVKATSFVVTSWNGDWLPKSYKSSHLNFQSHSHDSHRAGKNGKGRLVNLSYNEALDDVTKSKNIIGNCNVFCYPFGHYNETAQQALKDAGYTLAFTTKGRKSISRS